MRIIYIITALIVSMLALSISADAADFAVIVNKANTNTIDSGMIKKIYTGEMISWPNGGSITAVDLSESSPVRESFSISVLGKTVSSLKALWAQKIFSGLAVPPKTAKSDDEVKSIVSGNKDAIGYINTSSVDEGVKVVK